MSVLFPDSHDCEPFGQEEGDVGDELLMAKRAPVDVVVGEGEGVFPFGVVEGHPLLRL